MYFVEPCSDANTTKDMLVLQEDDCVSGLQNLHTNKISVRKKNAKEEAQAAAQQVPRPAGSLATCLTAASPIQYNIVPHCAPVAPQCQVKTESLCSSTLNWTAFVGLLMCPFGKDKLKLRLTTFVSLSS